MSVDYVTSAPVDPSTILITDTVLIGRPTATAITILVADLLTAALQLLTSGALSIDIAGTLTTSGNLDVGGVLNLGGSITASGVLSTDGGAINSDGSGNLDVESIGIAGGSPNNLGTPCLFQVNSDPNGSIQAAFGSLAININATGPTDRLYINIDNATSWTSVVCSA